MADIVIKKKVILDFLGDDYKDSFLVFKSIAVREYADLQDQIKKVEKDETKAIPFISEQLKDRFIEGTIQGQTIEAVDLEQLPGDVFVECFSQIMGKLTPKE